MADQPLSPKEPVEAVDKAGLSGLGGPMADTGPIERRFRGGALRFFSSAVGLEADASLFDPQNPALQAHPVSVGGRQSAWFVSGMFGQAVLRHYRRGGLVAKLSRDRYFWTGKESSRPFAELGLLDYLMRCGVPVARPLAAAYWRSGLFYRAAILTGRVAGARTLAEMPETRQAAAVAQAIFLMHEAGVWHADLNAYNILFGAQGQVYLIDFDRSRRQTIQKRHRRANLMRLQRSLVKVAGQQGLTCFEAIQRAYFVLLKQRSVAE